MTLPPDWFQTLAAKPDPRAQLMEKFAEGRYPRNIDPVILNDLFGRINQARVEALLPDPLLTQYREALASQHSRTLTLLDTSLVQLAKDLPLDVTLFSSFYPVSLFSSETLVDMALSEIARYLLSLPMPLQEGRTLKCHVLKPVNGTLEKHQRELEEAISHLFQRTLSQEEHVQPLTLREEQLLFKHAALVGQGKIVSWGTLLLIWLRTSEVGQTKIAEFSVSLHIDKMLYPDPIRPSPNPVPDCPFQTFVVDQAMNLLFRHPNSLLPRESVESEFRETMLQSIRVVQDTMFLVDSLNRMPRSKDFSIDNAFQLLHNVIPDRQSPHYRLMIGVVHFYNCIFRLDVETRHRPGLFKEIINVVQNHGEICNRKIPEEFKREPFALSELVEICNQKQISMKDCAIIAIRFACTFSTTEDLSPYLSLQEHCRAFNQFAKAFGYALPEEIVADLLLFQTANSATFPLIETMSRVLFDSKGKWLEALALPQELYQKWEAAAGSLLETIGTNPPGKYSPNLHITERKAKLFPQVLKMGTFLQSIVYPQPFCPLQELIPLRIDESSLQLTKEGTWECGLMAPVHSEVLSGPCRMNRWTWNRQRERLTLIAVIADSFASPANSSFFEIDLDIPSSPDAQQPFFSLLRGLVDTLGKEVLNDDEAQQWGERGIDFSYKIPEEWLYPAENPIERFDQLLSCSPLLEDLWKEHEGSFGDQASQAKKALYTFIHSYRTTFKQCFYSLNDPSIPLPPSVRKIELADDPETLNLFKKSLEALFLSLEKGLGPDPLTVDMQINESEYRLTLSASEKEGYFNSEVTQESIQTLLIKFPLMNDRDQFISWMRCQIKLMESITAENQVKS